jgi:hypothetical protein
MRNALIIATDRYDHAGLRDLRAPAADADALGGVLADPRIGEFAVQVARNESAHALQARIEDLFRQALPGDVLLVHFSCHGLKDESGDLFFAAADTDTDRLGSSTVPAHFVQRCMQRSRSRRVILLLDCCYGGAFPFGCRARVAGSAGVLDSFPQDKRDTGRGRVVITASTAMEFALEGYQVSDDRQAQPSVFSAALVQGLSTGEADLDGDGWISVGELYDYVYARVRERNPGQTPTSQGELAGPLYVARSVRGAVDSEPSANPALAATPGEKDARTLQRESLPRFPGRPTRFALNRRQPLMTKKSRNGRRFRYFFALAPVSIMVIAAATVWIVLNYNGGSPSPRTCNLAIYYVLHDNAEVYDSNQVPLYTKQANDDVTGPYRDRENGSDWTVVYLRTGKEGRMKTDDLRYDHCEP